MIIFNSSVEIKFTNFGQSKAAGKILKSIVSFFNGRVFLRIQASEIKPLNIIVC